MESIYSFILLLINKWPIVVLGILILELIFETEWHRIVNFSLKFGSQQSCGFCSFEFEHWIFKARLGHLQLNTNEIKKGH